MKRKILPLMALVLCISFGASAQNREKVEKEAKEKPEKVKKEKETDRKKDEVKEEKMTIVIDGNDITVNGKPLDELKEDDAELLREKGLRSLTPGMKRLMPLGGVKMFGGDLAGNKAFLGVTSNATDKGAKVITVQKESPAEKAGIKKDDIITKVNSTKIENSGDLYKAIGEYKPDEKVTVTYLRDGKEQTTNVTLEKNKNSNVTVFGNNDFGGNFKSFDFNDLPQLRNLEGMESLRGLKDLNGLNFSMNRKPKLGVQIQDVEEGKGVKVLDVDESTPAEKAGLKKDDVITAIDGKSIDSVDDLQSAIREKKEGDSFKLTYKRNGQVQTADIKFPKKLKTADL